MCKPLNGPNDMVVHPNDKSIWFTDPGYGAISIYEGKLANTGSLRPHQKEAVYRLDTQTGQVAKVADEPFKPNGIAFSHDYKKLYVCDTGIDALSASRECRVVLRHRRGEAVQPEKADRHGSSRASRASPTDCGVDTEGNIWVGAGWVGPGYDGDAGVRAQRRRADRTESCCRRPAPMSASAARSATACS
ncbi:SMP-30/gluconolactonase/LRE family protein [Bradyrhizobium betae]